MKPSKAHAQAVVKVTAYSSPSSAKLYSLGGIVRSVPRNVVPENLE